MGEPRNRKVYIREYRARNRAKVRMQARNMAAVHRDKISEYRKAHPEMVLKAVKKWRQSNPGANAAHCAVQRAVKSGAIQRSPICERCGVHTRTEAHHHRGYAYKLDVQWLCHPCHRLLDRKPI